MGLSSFIARAARKLGFGKNNASPDPPHLAPRPEAQVRLWEDAMDASVITSKWNFYDLRRAGPHAYSIPTEIQCRNPQSGLDETHLVPPPKEKYAVLTPGERWWRDMSGILETKGYRLRPRFQPGWRPSWQVTGRAFETCEDGYPRQIQETYFYIMDAVRISDDLPVVLKRLDTSEDEDDKNTDELDTTLGLLGETAGADPSNPCMRAYEILTMPDGKTRILVTPLLRPWESPVFETIGEVVDFFGQVLDGIAFLHQEGMAHRDCHAGNIMMDGRGMYPEGWHPASPDCGLGPKFNLKKQNAKRYTRTQRPPRYYIIDFGESGFYDRQQPVQDKFNVRGCPENDGLAKSSEPFMTDLYFVGNTMREYFVERAKGFEFMHPLVNAMTHPDPLARPSIEEAVRLFRLIVAGLPNRTLRARFVSTFDRPVGCFTYWKHRIGYVLNGLPPIPFRG